MDDLIVYRVAHGHYLPGRQRRQQGAAYSWLKEREIHGTEVRDASDEYALVVQGPTSLELLGLGEAPAFTHAMGEVAGVEVMVCRTGYTGVSRASSSSARRRTGLRSGTRFSAAGVVPCGLGARDTLRLGVCYPLHGNDITTETDAISAGLGGRAPSTPSSPAPAPSVESRRRARAPARRVRDGGEGDPRQGMPIAGGER